MAKSPSDTFPLDLADRCVKCGLCLPHCPTYQLTGNEAASPRGRIALMQGLATDQLQASTTLEKHLDGCLSCRACESVCPADVPYGELIDQGRALLNPLRQQATPGSQRLLNHVLTHNGLHRFTGRLLWLYQRLGLQWLIRHSHILGKGRLSRLEHFLPGLPTPRRPRSKPSTQPSRGSVALFTGCVSEWLASDVLNDAVALLNAWGFDVEVPEKQGCCGALHHHQGEQAASQPLADTNIQAFDGDYVAILGTASGCTAMLAEYHQVTPRGEAMSRLTEDISSFLLKHWPEDIKPSPLNATVAIHDPCTLKNVLKSAPAPYALLEKIPGINIKPLDDNATCCGASGHYFMTQPDMADKLGRRKRAAIERQRPDMIVSSNVGCAMQLQAQIREAGLAIPLLHPISLLRRQLAA